MPAVLTVVFEASQIAGTNVLMKTLVDSGRITGAFGFRRFAARRGVFTEPPGGLAGVQSTPLRAFAGLIVPMTDPVPDENSVTVWITGLKQGDAEAVRQLWLRYSQSLVRVARQRLGAVSRTAADEEDVALSAFWSLCEVAREGKLDEVCNRDDLWWMLLAITRRKAVSQVRRETAQKRGGWVQDLSLSQPGSPEGLQVPCYELISDEPTPEYVAMLQEEYERLLGCLRDDLLRSVAMLRIEGHTLPEIATKLGLSLRSVERKLRLIRSTWAAELRS